MVNGKRKQRLCSREKFLQLSEGLVDLKAGGPGSEIYIATGIVSGIVIVIVVLLLALVAFNRRKRSRDPPVVSTNTASASANFKEVEDPQPGQVSYHTMILLLLVIC